MNLSPGALPRSYRREDKVRPEHRCRPSLKSSGGGFMWALTISTSDNFSQGKYEIYKRGQKLGARLGTQPFGWSDQGCIRRGPRGGRSGAVRQVVGRAGQDGLERLLSVMDGVAVGRRLSGCVTRARPTKRGGGGGPPQCPMHPGAHPLPHPRGCGMRMLYAKLHHTGTRHKAAEQQRQNNRPFSNIATGACRCDGRQHPVQGGSEGPYRHHQTPPPPGRWGFSPLSHSHRHGHTFSTGAAVGSAPSQFISHGTCQIRAASATVW